MNVNLLIESIVRQTTVLIAQLATTAGARAPLAHVANQVFVELVGELRQQGVGNKVIADMFGLALRTYHARVRRLTESATVQGHSLWSAVLDYVQSRDTVLRSEVLTRFCHDDEISVRGVLRDLVDSGMLFRSGRESSTAYRAADSARGAEARGSDDESLANWTWVAISRHGPLTRDDLQRYVPMSDAQLEAVIQRLATATRIEILSKTADHPERYQSASCVIPLETEAGWEAAVWDHFQAMVTAIGTKLQSGERVARLGDAVGGSTYTFDVWAGHPYRQEVMSFLRQVRRQGVALREKVEAHNASVGGVPADSERVIAYVGQPVLGGHDGELEPEQ